MTRTAPLDLPPDDAVVLVTGANRGIGRELARQLALRGDAVVLTARDHLARAEWAAAPLGGHTGRYGRLDALVNNAAIHYDTWQHASTANLQVVREALEVNLLGAWQTSLPVAPAAGQRPRPHRQRLQTVSGRICSGQAT